MTPPSIREIRPGDGAVVPGFDGSLTFRFDEPIEPPRGLARQIQASPVGRYRVEFGFDRIEVRPEGGWLEGAVYQVRLPVGVSDLLGNEREGPLEVTFSTGPAIASTRVAGRILDRATRQPQEGARVLFLAVEGDSIPYGTVADTGGRFELRSLPPASYRSYAYRDLNGNLTLDRRLEPWDSTTVRLGDSTARAEARFSLLEPDSTPPRLALVEAVDSTLLQLEFDDLLDPAQPFGPDAVSVADTAGEAVAVAAVGLTREAVGLRAEGDTALPTDTAGEPAPADTGARADLPAADTGARTERLPAMDTAAAPDEPAPAAPGGGRDTMPAADTTATDTLPLPSRTVLVRLEEAMRDSVRYRVRARDLRNLQELAGGGDTTFVYTAARDTAPEGGPGARRTVPGDTAAVADTGVSRDTARLDSVPVDLDSLRPGRFPVDTAGLPDSAATDTPTTEPDTARRDSAPDAAVGGRARGLPESPAPLPAGPPRAAGAVPAARREGRSR